MTFIANPFLKFTRVRGIKAIDTPENVDVGFDANDEKQGYVRAIISDSENYMPFMFEDLRIPNNLLYFRAFLKPGMAEAFAPQWSENNYYGRTDPIPVYGGTTRTVDLSFDIVAWGPKDLPVMYKKLQKLQSMVYPLYDDKGFIQSGPIVRIRVGDLICAADNKGLPGYITSLDFSYDESIWNIKQDFKVPRNVTVSIAFTIIHERNPGLYKAKGENDFKFGTAEITQEGNNFTVGKISEYDIRKIFGKARE
jgi:hypothetical protein